MDINWPRCEWCPDWPVLCANNDPFWRTLVVVVVVVSPVKPFNTARPHSATSPRPDDDVTMTSSTSGGLQYVWQATSCDVVVAGDWLDERERLLQLSSYPTTTTPTTTTTTTTTTTDYDWLICIGILCVIGLLTWAPVSAGLFCLCVQ